MSGVNHDQVEEVAHLEVPPDAQAIVHVNLPDIVSFVTIDASRVTR